MIRSGRKVRLNPATVPTKSWTVCVWGIAFFSFGIGLAVEAERGDAGSMNEGGKSATKRLSQAVVDLREKEREDALFFSSC